MDPRPAYGAKVASADVAVARFGLAPTVKDPIPVEALDVLGVD
jgi:hypothetical protein